MRRAVKTVAALTVVIVVSYGLTSIRSESLYTFFAPFENVSNDTTAVPESSMFATALSAAGAFGDALERILSPEATYIRSR